MNEVLLGLVIVFVLMVLVYALDTATARLQPAAATIRRAAIVAGLGIMLGAFIWGAQRLASGHSVDAAVFAIAGAGAVLASVALMSHLNLAGRVFPAHVDSGRFEVGLVLLLWLVIFQLVSYYTVDEEIGEVDIVAAAMQTVALLGVALASVGFLTRRSAGATLSRLGLDRVTARDVWIGSFAVIPMAVLGAISVLLVDWLSPGTSERLADTVEQITGGETSLGYALALGIFAAVGEETLFRGALQPKYGLVVTSLIFALLHVQYDLLLVVASLFPVGLILGLERKYLGTAACIVTHALYNTIAVAAG